MAEPRLRFKDDNGNAYPEWQEYELDEILTERNEPHLITEDAPQLSFTIEQGVIYPEDKKTNKRDFLMKDKDNKKFLLTEYNDIIYNPANLKFGAIHRNVLGRGVVSPIYAIFYTDQNPAFIEGIVTNPKFIKSSLKYLEGTVVKLMTLKPRDFVKMKVWIPLLEEQKKIADFLSSVDEVIAASEQEVANLETQKKAVMKKIFSQEVRFKREDGTDFPEWEERPFYNCVDINANMVQPDVELYGDLPHIGPGNIEKGTGSLTEYKFVRDETLISGKYLFSEKDVIYGKINPQLMKVAYPRFKGLCSADAYPISVHPDVMLPEFLLYSLLETRFVKYSISVSMRTGMPKINRDELGYFNFRVPCLEEQHLIADFLSSFDEAIAAAKKELELWKELKKGLLQQMFV